jgi:hypothetical protein
VIIVIAHADEQIVYLPAPPPEGSTVSPEDIAARKSEIQANRPFVYLFCCETAQVGNFTNITRALLDAGAVGVVAPQTRINPEEYANLFEQFVGGTAGANSLEKLLIAEQITGNRDMETWLG